VEAVVEGRIDARRELEEALDERDIAQGRFEAAIGTSAEMGAYQRLRRATRRVSVADRAARRETESVNA
jgi:hypothetical protein